MTILQFLKEMINRDASDLHIIAGLVPHLRIHGGLVPLNEFGTINPDTAKDLIYAVLSDRQRNAFENSEEDRYELDFAYGVPGLGRFRFNVHLQRGTVATTVRALANRIPQLDELGVPETVRQFSRTAHGLVLVTGPTGSGKSTTLASLIDEINRNRECHIITIEDPIEYLHNSKKSIVTQREIGLAGDTLSFKNALKYALRQDPDVILIGEMRDYETIEIAVTSAETGHLVFGTLHTPGAAQTVHRIINVFPAERQPQIVAQLASNLIGVVSQVLLPRVDQSGRCLASEVMIANHAIRNCIRSNKIETIEQIIQTSGAEGMMNLDRSLIRLCQEGKINYAIAKPYIQLKSTHQSLEKYDTPAEPRWEAHDRAKMTFDIPPWDR